MEKKKTKHQINSRQKYEVYLDSFTDAEYSSVDGFTVLPLTQWTEKWLLFTFGC